MIGRLDHVLIEAGFFRSLAIFFLCIYIVHGIFIYGEDDRALRA